MLSIIQKAAFPSVADLPGVPLLTRAVGSTAATTLISSIQGRIWRALSTESQWGLFDSKGQPVALADSVLEVSADAGSKTSTYPIQSGSFASYNKVHEARRYTVRMAKGGNLTIFGQSGRDGRKAFIEALEAAQHSFDLFTVVTPERVYPSVTIESFNYRRDTSSGAYMIIADLQLIEVRQVEASYTQKQPINTSNAQSVNAASPQSGGQVQAAPTPAPVKQSILRQMANSIT